MSRTLHEFREKFQLDDLTILRSTHWTWSVRPVHSTLGAGILSLNRFCEHFGEMTAEEGADLAAITRRMEGALTRTFQPGKFNYIMLMMVDHHLHFHVLPRYDGLKQFGGLDWKDSGWPKVPALGDYDDRASSPVLLLVRDALKSAV